jgi:hypothetical protein
MSISSAPEPPNVYLAWGSIWGKTRVREAAASTVGASRPPARAELDVSVTDLELEAPLPQPATTRASAAAPAAARPAAARPAAGRPEATRPVEMIAFAANAASSVARMLAG